MAIVSETLDSFSADQISLWLPGVVLPSPGAGFSPSNYGAAIPHGLYRLGIEEWINSYTDEEVLVDSFASKYFFHHVKNIGMVAIVVDLKNNNNPIALAELSHIGAGTQFSRFLTGPMVNWVVAAYSEAQQSDKGKHQNFKLKSIQIDELQMYALWLEEVNGPEQIIYVPGRELRFNRDSLQSKSEFPVRSGLHNEICKLDVTEYTQYVGFVAKSRIRSLTMPFDTH